MGAAELCCVFMDSLACLTVQFHLQGFLNPVNVSVMRFFEAGVLSPQQFYGMLKNDQGSQGILRDSVTFFFRM